MITPQQLLYFLLIQRTLLMGRLTATPEEDDDADRNDREQSQTVMRFLCFNMKVGSCEQYADMNSFFEAIYEFVKNEGFIDRLRSFYRSINSSEELDDLVTSGKSLFEIDGAVSQNNLHGPIMMTKNSILGVFVRSVMANWDCLMFEEVCAAFDRYALFVSTDKSSAYRDRHSRRHCDLLSSAEAVLQHQNISAAEDLIHSYYDSIVDPNSLGVQWLGRDNGYHTRQQLRTLNGLESNHTMQVYQSKYQHGMMSLALLHMHAKNWGQTAIAIEEALKTAHQRGDHASVAKCLMFLHQLSLYRGDISLEDNEDLIRRSISRAATNNLNDLVANGAVLLAAFKSQVSQSSSQTKDHSSMWSPQEVMDMFNYAMHGESSLILQYAANRSITTNLEECLISTNNANASAMLRQQAQQANAQTPGELPALIDADYIQRSILASLCMAEFWLSQDRPYLASLHVMRTVRSFGARCKSLDLLLLLTKLVDLKLNLISSMEELVALQRDMASLRQKWEQEVSSEMWSRWNIETTKIALIAAILQNDRRNLSLSLGQMQSIARLEAANDIDYCRNQALVLLVKKYYMASNDFDAVECEVEWNGLVGRCNAMRCSYVLRERILVTIEEHMVRLKNVV